MPNLGVNRNRAPLFSTWIEITGAIIIIAGCSLLFGVGTFLIVTDRPASAGTAWGFGFLLVVLLLLAKFKRFKGFGFEAELWEDKQAEAAALVDQMRSLSKLICKQMATVAARLGYFNSTLSLLELAVFVEDLQSHLAAVDFPGHEREEVLQPLYQRIESGYRRAATHRVGTAFRGAQEKVQAAFGSPDNEERRHAASLVTAMNQESLVLLKLDDAPIDELSRFVEHSAIIAQKSLVVDELQEIERDLEHFRKTRSFRRREWLPT